MLPGEAMLDVRGEALSDSDGLTKVQTRNELGVDDTCCCSDSSLIESERSRHSHFPLVL
jgi:hypothetical protein